MEFKKVESVNDLEKAAEDAVLQIKQKKYIAQAEQRGNTNILIMGLAFCGKQFKIKYELVAQSAALPTTQLIE